MKNICIFGMGGIGGYVGARIVKARDARPAGSLSVGFVARGAHLEAIRAKGLTYQAPDGTKMTVRPDAAASSAADLPPQDLVLLCVKGYDLTAACEAIVPITGKNTVILPLLNGIDIHERIRRVVRTGIVLPGCIYIASSIREPGFVAHGGGKGNIIAGHDPGNGNFDPAPLRRLMSDAGIPFEWQDDPFPALWIKYLFIASYALVTGMSGKPFGAVVADPQLSGLVRDILKETYALATAKGVKLPPSIVEDSFEKGKTFPFETKTSYLRDVEVPGKPNEGDLFGGTIIRMGKELGVPTPVTEKVYRSIQDGKTTR